MGRESEKELGRESEGGRVGRGMVFFLVRGAGVKGEKWGGGGMGRMGRDRGRGIKGRGIKGRG